MTQSFTKSVPLDTDVTLSGDSNGVTPSQHAVKTYVDNQIAGVPAPYPEYENFWNSGTQGNYAIRAKNDSTVNALGNYAFAIGQNSIASGAYSYAQGFQTKAINVGASAEGNLTVASGVNAHAEGNGAIASGNDSHAEGSGIASGDTSHAEGLGSKAYGAASHAEGVVTVASGTYSFAGGNANHAIGIASAALGGRNNRVSGNNSVVLGGSGTVATYDDTVFVPKLNIRNIQTGTPLLNLGADVNGNVVIGTTGTGGGSITDGWNTDGNSWTFLSADAPSYVVSVNANVTGTIGVGMKNQLTHQSQTKNFFITAISVTGSTSYLTLYGGTDYTLNVTGTITNPKYSQAKSPFGFSTNPNKWSVTFTNTQQLTQANPTQNTWYNLGNLSVSVPIGVWRFRWSVLLHGFDNSTAITVQGTVSTANNSESNSKMTASATNNTGGATSVRAIITAFVTDVVELSSKTTHYFNARATTATPNNIYFSNDVVPLFFTAECAYL